MRQRRGRGVNANVVALREWRHPHVGGPAERLLVRVQGLRQLRPGQLPPYHHGRLVRILEDNGRASLANRGGDIVVHVNVRAPTHARHRVVHAGISVRVWTRIGEQRHVVRVLRRGKGMAGAGTTIRRWKRDGSGRWLNPALQGTTAPLVARLLVISLLGNVRGAVATCHVVHAGRSPLTAAVAPIACVTVHAARGRFAVAARVTVPRHRAGSAITPHHGVQRWRIGGIRARRQFLVRHSWICSAQASWRVSSVRLEPIKSCFPLVLSRNIIYNNEETINDSIDLSLVRTIVDKLCLR